MYKFIIEGEYFSNGGAKGQMPVKNYVVEAILPDEDLHHALSVIKNELLADLIKAKHPDYAKYRTHHVQSFHQLNDDGKEMKRELSDSEIQSKEVYELSREELVRLISLTGLPIKSANYPSINALQEAVKSARKDLKKFLKLQEEQEKKAARLKKLRELNSLELEKNPDNPDLMPLVQSEGDLSVKHRRKLQEAMGDDPLAELKEPKKAGRQKKAFKHEEEK